MARWLILAPLAVPALAASHDVRFFFSTSAALDSVPPELCDTDHGTNPTVQPGQTLYLWAMTARWGTTASWDLWQFVSLTFTSTVAAGHMENPVNPEKEWIRWNPGSDFDPVPDDAVFMVAITEGGLGSKWDPLMGTSPDPSNTRIFLLGELRYDLPGDYQTYIGPKGIGGKFEIDPTYAWFGFLPGQCQGWDGPVKTYEFGESGLYADVHVVPEPRAAALLALGTAAAAARRGCRRSARRPDAQRRRRAGSPVGRCPSAILLDNRRAGRGGIITSGGRTSVAGWFFSGCPISRGGRTMRRVLACSLPRSLPRPLDLGDIRGIVKVGFDEEAIVMDDDALLMDRVDRTSAESFGTDAAPGMTPPPPEPEQTTAPFAPSDAPPEAQEAPAPLRHATGPAAQPTPPQIIEALLFASDAPLSLTRLTELVGGCTPVEVRLHIAALNDTYVAAGLSFRIESIARGYRMLTLPRFQPWLARLNQQRSQTRLSPAALETLSIVAYKQPIIRADIEAIRGVACGEVLNRLRDMGLVRIAGRAEVVGRPLMYATTRKFLDTFGLADVDDLPPMEALSIRRPPAAAEPEMPAPAPEPPLAVSA